MDAGRRVWRTRGVRSDRKELIHAVCPHKVCRSVGCQQHPAFLEVTKTDLLLCAFAEVEEMQFVRSNDDPVIHITTDYE
jgi:hypothetical protein